MYIFVFYHIYMIAPIVSAVQRLGARVDSLEVALRASDADAGAAARILADDVDKRVDAATSEVEPRFRVPTPPPHGPPLPNVCRTYYILDVGWAVSLHGSSVDSVLVLMLVLMLILLQWLLRPLLTMAN